MFMKMVEFISMYKLDLMIVLTVLIAIVLLKVYSLKSGNGAKLKSIVLGLVIEAEKYLGSKTGEIKKQQVINWLYIRYPFIAWVIPRDTMNVVIEEQVKQLKEYLSSKGADLYGLDQELDILSLNCIGNQVK